MSAGVWNELIQDLENSFVCVSFHMLHSCAHLWDVGRTSWILDLLNI